MDRLPDCFRCGSQPCTCKDGITLYHADCRDVLPLLPPVDLVLTDPPYDDYHTETYEQTPLTVISGIALRMIIFWSAKTSFPLDVPYSIHIWDKKTGCGSQYERIFHIGGDGNWRVFNYYLINSPVAASYTGDVYTGHPSQKPVRLVASLLLLEEVGLVFDPFAGSGTTGRACKDLGRKCIQVEIEERYCEIATRRLEQEVLFANPELCEATP